MTVLNDREILARCTLPIEFYVMAHHLYAESRHDGVLVITRLMNVPDDLRNEIIVDTVQICLQPGDSPYLVAEKWHPVLMEYWRPMISPASETQIRKIDDRPAISYGLSSFGYDLRVGNKFRVFKEAKDYPELRGCVLDPKNVCEDLLEDVETDCLIIPPHGFALGVSVERICIPRDIVTICLGKSTYARVGLVVNVTPFEPEWEGYVTLEFSNTTSWPVKIYANEGVTQVLFFQGNPCKTSYADRYGKYQNQPNVPVVSKL